MTSYQQAYFIFGPVEAFRAVSSVGLEHYLDRVGVTGSNPVQPTSFKVIASVSLMVEIVGNPETTFLQIYIW